ncbi:MAG TPA: hypothetical protein VEW90_03990 [Gaiellaceae bacterium]|nr:hypothetical protein [Gaiellaceae bacterium]
MGRAEEMLSSLAAGAAIPGVMGVGPGRTWDAVAAAHAPELPGDSVTFFALEDGTLIVTQDIPDGALAPVADALEETVSPPYRAATARNEGDMWTAVAESVRIVTLAGVEGDEVDFTVVGGERTLTVGGEPSAGSLPALDALADEHESVALHAERVDGDLFAVDVFPL